MPKMVLGAAMTAFAVLLGFGTCAVFAATYGQASSTLAIGLLISFFTSLALFMWGTVLMALGMRHE